MTHPRWYQDQFAMHLKDHEYRYAYSLFDGNMDCQARPSLKSSQDLCKSRAALSFLEPLFQSLPYGLPLCS